MSLEDGPFDDPGTRRDAAVFGMWVFLLTELLFFGGVFAVYAAYRRVHFAAFAAGAARLDAGLGALNTAVLLTSSLAMALGARSAARGRARAAGGWLCATAALGALFLVVKGVEWAHKAQAGLFPGRLGELPGGERLFFGLYFALTGLHAAHVGIGVAVLAWAAERAFRRRWSPARYAPVECAGLYWHFVDVVWIFLFPLLYLIRGPR